MYVNIYIYFSTHRNSHPEKISLKNRWTDFCSRFFVLKSVHVFFQRFFSWLQDWFISLLVCKTSSVMFIASSTPVMIPPAMFYFLSFLGTKKFRDLIVFLS